MGHQQIALSLLTTLGFYGVYKFLKFLYNNVTSPLRILPGPPSPSIIYGNLKEIWGTETPLLHENWVEVYGPTITYKGFIGTNRLYTTDPKAINHILMNSHIYQKPEAARYSLSRDLGKGLLVVEGAKHRQQRRIMNPAFGTAQIRELTEIFIQKSIQLRDIWTAESSREGSNGRLDVLSWLSKMTLDVIGLAGFNYQFEALTKDPKENELHQAFSTLFQAGISMTLITMLRAMVPALRFLPAARDAEAKVAATTMARIGNQLLRDSKAGVVVDDETGGKFENSVFKRRDILSLLLRANMSTDLPPSQRMTDDDALAQVLTFLVAGHETTSTATTWALFALAKCPKVQSKLRNELLAVGTENPTMDELNALPYLDAVVRETLRVHPPLASTLRFATEDDVLPFSTPVKDKNGNMIDSIIVKKGQTFSIPILALNRLKSIWGDDALEFKPERWEKVPDAVATIPCVWGNMMTFLGGPRACIGYRFSVVEMKALLFTLIKAFEFELAVPSDDIIKKAAFVQRPLVKSDLKSGTQMPLILKPIHG